jgi:hypothetical protein
MTWSTRSSTPFLWPTLSIEGETSMPPDRSDPDYRKLIFQGVLEEANPYTLMDPDLVGPENPG